MWDRKNIREMPIIMNKTLIKDFPRFEFRLLIVKRKKSITKNVSIEFTFIFIRLFSYT